MPTVVIVEDNLMIADMAEEELVSHGYTVCGIARTVAAAVALCRAHHPDLAVIDLKLEAGELGTAIPAALGGLGGMGVLYATGNITHAALTLADGHALLGKPYSAADLVRALELVVDLAAGRKVHGPFPRSFAVINAAAAPPLVALHD